MNSSLKTVYKSHQRGSCLKNGLLIGACTIRLIDHVSGLFVPQYIEYIAFLERQHKQRQIDE